MALIKRGDIYHVRAQVAGVMIARSTKTKNKRIAEQLEAKWISEVHSEVVVANRMPITFEKAVIKYAESRRGTRVHHTIASKFKLFNVFANRTLHEIKAAEVTTAACDLVSVTGYAINTVNVSILYWNALQNFCSKNGFTPGPKIKRLAGAKGRIRFLSDEEVTKLMKELDPANPFYRKKAYAQESYDFTVALLHTGARDQEICTLKLSQIDLGNNTITIHRSKGGTDTTITMSNTLREVVLRRIATSKVPNIGKTLHGRADEVHLFPERCKLTKHGNVMFIDACERIGITDVSLHTLRHTFACKLLRNGLSLNEVQHALGHKNIASTMCYAHIAPNLTGNRIAAVFNT
jgi:integrase